MRRPPRAWLALLRLVVVPCAQAQGDATTPAPTAFPYQEDLVAYYNLSRGVVAGSFGPAGGAARGPAGAASSLHAASRLDANDAASLDGSQYVELDASVSDAINGPARPRGRYADFKAGGCRVLITSDLFARSGFWSSGVAAPPRRRRGSSVGTGRGAVAATINASENLRSLVERRRARPNPKRGRRRSRVGDTRRRRDEPPDDLLLA